jgi:hypothetical protein
LPNLGNHGRGYQQSNVNVLEWFSALSTRLQRVRIAQGDWARIVQPSNVGPWTGLPVAVFLDPPYDGYEQAYNDGSKQGVSADVREWALAHGNDLNFRIALCGYEGEHAMPDSWSVFAWKSKGGYGNQSDEQGRENSARERIWFSPHCLKPERQLELFA